MCECNSKTMEEMYIEANGKTPAEQLRRDIIDLTREYTALLNSDYIIAPANGLDERAVVLDQIAVLIQEMVLTCREYDIDVIRGTNKD